MTSRVTLQDIADALGLSRNTVSKAINNTGVLADATREKVLKKAIEMGYKQFTYVNLQNAQEPSIKMDVSGIETSPAPSGGVIALLTTQFLGNSHFSSTMLDRVQRELSLLGYSFMMHRITENDLASLRLPVSLKPEMVSGIMCIEVFDAKYSDFLCSLGLPVLFVDGPVPEFGHKVPADFLMMNNHTEILSFVAEMKNRGKTRIGFVGEKNHCLSFLERYSTWREALDFWNLPLNDAYAITGNQPGISNPSSSDYRAYLEEKIRALPSLPDVFLCANDFVALDLMQVFKKLGIRVPQDVYLCGFDDSPESRVTTPTLTTIHIHSQIMGYSAVHLLLSRIKDPSLHYRTIYTETTLIYRESTED